MIRALGDKVPKIAESSFISEAAYILGDVVIGERSAAFPGAVVRADFGPIRIGDDVLIEDNVVLHGDSKGFGYRQRRDTGTRRGGQLATDRQPGADRDECHGPA